MRIRGSVVSVAGMLFAAAILVSQQIDWPTQIKRPPILDARTYQFTITNGSGVSATLSVAGSNTLTFSKCPLGTAGTDARHYLRISGGTGTAESVLITGGTCTSGALNKTLIVTTANTHTGAWIVSSGSSGIKEAINSLPSNGGYVAVPSAGSPYTLYQTVVVGDGSAAGGSTLQGVSLVGDGAGSSASEAFPTGAATMFSWAGPVGGTMLEFAGPMAAMRLEGIFFDCNISARAATAFYTTHMFDSEVRDLKINGCSGYGIKHYAYDNPVGVVAGANHNVWEQIGIFSHGSTTSGGMQIGAASDSGGIHLDVAGNIFKNIGVGAGSAGYGVNLRFVDASTFENLNLTSGLGGILVTPVIVGGAAHFPANITCTMCYLGSNPVDDSAWSTAYDEVGMLFQPYNNDSTLVPDPVGTNGWSAGYSMNLRYFGKWKTMPGQFTTINSSSAISNTTAETAFDKSYTIQAGVLNRAGLIVRARASGTYSTTGTPTIAIGCKIGGTGVDGNTFGAASLATANNASSLGWSAEFETVVRATGSPGTMLQGFGLAGMGGSGPSVNSNRGTYAMDTTIAKGIFCTVIWGSASSSNTITMDQLSVDIVAAGVTN